MDYQGWGLSANGEFYILKRVKSLHAFGFLSGFIPFKAINLAFPSIPFHSLRPGSGQAMLTTGAMMIS